MPCLIGESHEKAHQRMLKKGFRLIGSNITCGTVRNIYSDGSRTAVIILSLRELVVIMATFNKLAS